MPDRKTVGNSLYTCMYMLGWWSILWIRGTYKWVPEVLSCRRSGNICKIIVFIFFACKWGFGVGVAVGGLKTLANWLVVWTIFLDQFDNLKEIFPYKEVQFKKVCLLMKSICLHVENKNTWTCNGQHFTTTCKQNVTFYWHSSCTLPLITVYSEDKFLIKFNTCSFMYEHLSSTATKHF